MPAKKKDDEGAAKKKPGKKAAEKKPEPVSPATPPAPPPFAPRPPTPMAKRHGPLVPMLSAPVTSGTHFGYFVLLFVCALLGYLLMDANPPVREQLDLLEWTADMEEEEKTRIQGENEEIRKENEELAKEYREDLKAYNEGGREAQENTINFFRTLAMVVAVFWIMRIFFGAVAKTLIGYLKKHFGERIGGIITPVILLAGAHALVLIFQAALLHSPPRHEGLAYFLYQAPCHFLLPLCTAFLTFSSLVVNMYVFSAGFVAILIYAIVAQFKKPLE